jgi:hypothetical protein
MSRRKLSDSRVSIVPTSTHSRAFMDLIIQRSTIELFDSYGVAVAPAQSSEIPPNQADLVGSVQLSGAAIRGVLTLAASSATLARTLPQTSQPLALQDWVRELTNQLAGRVRNRFARYQLSIQVSLPTSKDPKSQAPPAGAKRTELVYVFRTLKDDVIVKLSGDFDEGSLVFSSSPAVAEEGEVILF